MVSAKRRSCKTQLILTVEDLTGEINKGSQTNVILLDSLEAVDKILYKHLLLMLILLFQLHACETCLLKSPAPRKVTQYQYIEWPENGLPTTTSFVTFWRYVISMTEDNSAPLLVHCR